MEQSEMRKALIESAVYVVSHNGIAHVTTDALVKRANVNVAYLYRVCGGKDKLLEDTFTELDCEFRDAIMKYTGADMLEDVMRGAVHLLRHDLDAISKG